MRGRERVRMCVEVKNRRRMDGWMERERERGECVCAWRCSSADGWMERGERERKIERERARERDETVCVCGCISDERWMERGEREREIDRERERERERERRKETKE